MFNALLLQKSEEGKVTSAMQSLEESALPEGDVIVRVDYSTLNYKDGMVLSGVGGLVRNYPHIPGVDFAGTVESSEHAEFNVGDKVILTGWRVGEMRWGGYAEKARVKGDWLVHQPSSLNSQQAMAIGTAGLTAMLGLIALEKQGVTPDSGPILITGATGGVGSIACSLLANRGYEIHASTGKPESAEYLKNLGATKIIARDELADWNGRPLNKEVWAGAVDSVGGSALANVLTQVKYGGSVAAIGLAGGNKLETTVIPFLLRGVNLLGIDSVVCPSEPRNAAWQRVASELDLAHLASMTSMTPLTAIAEKGREILSGGITGRVVVDVNA